MTRRVRMVLDARKKIYKIMPFPITKQQAGHAWNWARNKMGLKKDKEFVIHAVRHTFATRLVNEGTQVEYRG